MSYSPRLRKTVLQRLLEPKQFTSIGFGRRCVELGVRPSMGSIGDCFDNAMAESFFSTLECEVLDRNRFRTRQQARTAIFSWLEGWYNPHRRHSSLGYLSPRDFEARRSRRSNASEPGACAALRASDCVSGRPMNMKISRGG